MHVIDKQEHLKLIIYVFLTRIIKHEQYKLKQKTWENYFKRKISVKQNTEKQQRIGNEIVCSFTIQIKLEQPLIRLQEEKT